MKSLECIIFNVEHGFCAFVKSPNGYGLLIDCGSRDLFCPIKWARKHYNLGENTITYFQGRRIAECIISHLHADHFDNVGSLTGVEKPKHLIRDKSTLPLIDQKINDEKVEEHRKEILKQFKKFQADYDQLVKDKVDWGFDFFEYDQISYKDAREVSESDDKLINNRSFIVAVSYAGHKILFPGDIEVEGWKKALELSRIKKILSNTNFFVASHHGHKSGFTSEILEYTGIPDIYLISAIKGDEHIDSSYSDAKYSNGFLIDGEGTKSRSVSTRKRQESIKITISENGTASISLLEADDNLDKHQRKIINRRTKRVLNNWG